MKEMPEHVIRDFRRSADFIKDNLFQPRILIITVPESFPLSNLLEYFGSYLNDENIVVGDGNIFPEKRRVINHNDLTNCVLEEIIENLDQMYKMVLNNHRYCPVVYIRPKLVKLIYSELERTLIPISMFRNYNLGEMKKVDFKKWFSCQMPTRIPEDTIDIMIDGTGTDINNARKLLEDLFHFNDWSVTLIDENGCPCHSAKFSVVKGEPQLRTGDGMEARVPVPAFLFDTNVFTSKIFPVFLKFIGDGEYCLPNLVREEIHHLEEKFKKENKIKLRSLLKSNQKLLIDSFKARGFRGNVHKKNDYSDDIRKLSFYQNHW
jgi:hypothetical protein